MITKRKLVIGLILTVLLAAVPVGALHWLGIFGCAIIIGALILNHRGQIKVPVTPHLLKIVAAVFVASFVLAFGAGLLRSWLGFAFWVFALSLVCPLLKKLWAAITTYFATHKIPPLGPPIGPSDDSGLLGDDDDDSDDDSDDGADS